MPEVFFPGFGRTPTPCSSVSIQRPSKNSCCEGSGEMGSKCSVLEKHEVGRNSPVPSVSWSV